MGQERGGEGRGCGEGRDIRRTEGGEHINKQRRETKTGRDRKTE